MHSLIEEFKPFAKTRICMSCYDKENESLAMIGAKDGVNIQKHGEMYVLNDSLETKPTKMEVLIS